MAKGKAWLEDEEKVILEQVKIYPQNLKKAFSSASIILGTRSPNACSNRWYRSISKYEGKEYTAFVALSKAKYSRNRKTVNEDIPTHTKQSIWSRIINYFFK